MNDLERRRQIALSQLDIVIDVLSAWRGEYDDDGRPASIDWITAVIPQEPGGRKMGWLPVAGTAQQGIGWAFIKGAFALRSRCGTLAGLPFPVTRRQFRDAARASGVSLPPRHATLHLSEKVMP